LPLAVCVQVLKMEHLLLKVLRFDVAVPTVNVFCDRFLKEAKADEKTISLAMVCIYQLCHVMYKTDKNNRRSFILPNK